MGMYTDDPRRIRNRDEYIPVIAHQGGPSRAKQQFADDCDINLIVERHASTGLWDHLAKTQPTYGDYSAATDLHTAIQMVDEAEDRFMALPANVRSLCQNDPVNFLQRLADQQAFDELVQAGLPVGPEYQAPARAPAPEEPAGDGGETAPTE